MKIVQFPINIHYTQYLTDSVETLCLVFENNFICKVCIWFDFYEIKM